MCSRVRPSSSGFALSLATSVSHRPIVSDEPNGLQKAASFGYLLYTLWRSDSTRESVKSRLTHEKRYLTSSSRVVTMVTAAVAKARRVSRDPALAWCACGARV